MKIKTSFRSNRATFVGKKEDFKVEGISEPDKTVKGIQHHQFNDFPVKVSDGCDWGWEEGEKTSSADGFENHPSPEMIHASFSHIWEAKSNYHSICSGQARITETVLNSVQKRNTFWIKLQARLYRDFLFLSNLVTGRQEGQLPVGGLLAAAVEEENNWLVELGPGFTISFGTKVRFTGLWLNLPFSLLASVKQDLTYA